jgi:two-component sensor histidine kinase
MGLAGVVQHGVFWRQEGTSFPVEYIWSPLCENETVTGAVLTFSDIALRTISTAEMLHVLASVQCLLWYADVQFVSEDKPLRWFLWPMDETAALRFLPIPITEGQTFAQAFYASRLEEDKPRSDDCGRQAILAGRSYRQEYRCRRVDGQIRWISEVVQVEKVSEGHWRATGVCTDITELKQREQEIAVLNARLQQAMTETHHRVKNNLQIIAAMIDLQIIEQPEMLPLAEFVRLSHHVRTLAAVHDILTHSSKAGDHIESVSARTILDHLLTMIQSTAGKRRVRYTLDDARLSSRQATTLALVANELVSNALKHGKGDVEVTFAVQEAAATLEVCDDGPGFSADFDPAQAANTGLDLVETLISWDMRGTVRFENRSENGGARVVVSFGLEARTDQNQGTQL